MDMNLFLKSTKETNKKAGIKVFPMRAELIFESLHGPEEGNKEPGRKQPVI
jgi:hypothetical protein